ncbi:hypothetical protein ACFSHP_11370 [Novosphingobium panipatense]
MRNNAAEPVTIAGVHVAGAENAEMHETKGEPCARWTVSS